MKIAISADADHSLLQHIIQWCHQHGHEVTPSIPTDKHAILWPEAAKFVAEKIINHQAENGILLCWTGTGVDMAANKFAGIRAALCTDSETASGAKKWNDANVLCLSMRLTTPEIADEILTAWFNTEFETNEENNRCLEMLS